jgi:hypothetical protein
MLFCAILATALVIGIFVDVPDLLGLPNMKIVWLPVGIAAFFLVFIPYYIVALRRNPYRCLRCGAESRYRDVSTAGRKRGV